jgi:K+-transporting ATPase KdpF subunit
MSPLHVLGGVIASALLVYLFFALLAPERLS